MCIALYYVGTTGRYKFILLFNREEYSTRPTQPLGVIADDRIVGGLDLKEGGTWLAINTSNGAIACLTNRNPVNHSIWNTIQMSIETCRTIIPQVGNILYPKLQSRGNLILNLVKSTDNIPPHMEITSQQHRMQLNCKLQPSEFDVVGVIKQAQLNRQKYRAFNLFVGSISQQKVHTYSSINNMEQSVNGFGSMCSFSDVGKEQVLKEKIAMDKFKVIVDSGEDVIQKLFELATQQFRSNESCFKLFPHEASFFINEYTTTTNLKRGTRTTTLVLYDGVNLQVLEQTYI